MKKMASTKAKSHFGLLLDTAQREPVVIEKQGRPVAVLLSMEDYKYVEKLKLEALDKELQIGIDELDAGLGIDGKEVFEKLLKRIDDVEDKRK